MGLDATVNCNCFELGLHKEQPPCTVVVTADGSLDCKSNDLDTQLSFDKWQLHACEHESGILLHHRIGNIAQVGLLRSELKQDELKFPILLTKVLYNGIHSGDYLTSTDIDDLQLELDNLRSWLCSTPSNQEYIDWFRQQMTELVEAATKVRKPISF